MKRYIFTLIAVLLTAAGCSQEVQDESEKVVVAYVTSWSTVMPDPDRVTHINYAFGHVSDSFDGVRIDNEDRLRSITALRDDAPSLKVLLSVGGWGSGRPFRPEGGSGVCQADQPRDLPAGRGGTSEPLAHPEHFDERAGHAADGAVEHGTGRRGPFLRHSATAADARHELALQRLHERHDGVPTAHHRARRCGD